MKKHDNKCEERIVYYGNRNYNVSDIDKFVAEGGLGTHIGNSMKHHIITYLMNEKGYSENDAWLTHDAWATNDNRVYGILKRDYEAVVNEYREIVGLPPMKF